MTTFVHQEDVLGCTHRYLATGDDGGPAVIEITLPPGSGAPPHVHAGEDEVFYGLEGEVTFGMEGAVKPIVLRAGDDVSAPRGRGHGFQNQGTVPARMLAVVLPGSNLTTMFAELSTLAMPPDPQAVRAITARHGVTMRG